ncbi:tyrosine-type recombinase/integrase [Congregibacter brevis]|uniref:Tyrosine-type recombinase/integrase n=1 Tax=Congregibacter brevis TaxID=3081201 RepID=A0ABZ0IFW5_9GAMM|nr:tyrosine-type recombinase/integrase [Congregibacter sp. IMCC45268]
MAGKKVVKNPSQKRTRYVEDWELKEFLSVASPFLTSYVALKLALGLRKGDMLSIRIDQISDEGLLVRPRKTLRSSGKSMLFVWTDHLRECIKHALDVCPKPGNEYLFCNRFGSPYIKLNGTTSGFDSIWQRAMVNALAKTELRDRFTEHDLRAKVASDTSAQHAKELMGHSNQGTTDRVYRRKALAIKPAR